MSLKKEGRAMSERWVILPEGAQEGTQASFAQILAVHAVLLHTGKILYFGGSEHVLDDPTLRSVDDNKIDNTRIWDPVTGVVAKVPSPQPPPEHLYDLFCCGHAFLADGRLRRRWRSERTRRAACAITTTSIIVVAVTLRFSILPLQR